MSGLSTAAIKYRTVSDLYSVQQFVFNLGLCNRIYMKLEEGSFQRPAFFIKMVSMNLEPRNSKTRRLRQEMMIQYFSNDYYDAMGVSSELLLALSGAPYYADVILPQYDFSKSPPAPYSINGYDQGPILQENTKLGPRVLPETLSSNGVVQEDNREYVSSITFTMLSPVVTEITGDVIEEIDLTVINDRPRSFQVLVVQSEGKIELEEEILG